MTIRHIFGVWQRWSSGYFVALVFLLFALNFPAVALAETPSLEVKLDGYGRPTIPVTLPGTGGAKYFLFDTAARRNLLLNRDSGAPGVKRYANGKIRHYSSQGLLQLPAATIASWKIGNRTVRNSITGFYPHSFGTAGLVGNNVFVGRILHWKPGAKAFNVFTNTAPFADASWHNVGGRPNRHFSVLMRALYRDLEIRVVVATGAEKTLMDVDTLHKLFPNAKGWLSGNFEFKNIEFGLGSDRRNYRSFTLPNFKIGAWDLDGIEVFSATIDAEQITGDKRAPVMILGSDILMKHEVAFDFRDYQLWIKD